MELSPFQIARYEYKPKIPALLKKSVSTIRIERGKPTESFSDTKELQELFPHTYGQPIAALVPGKNPRAAEKINIGVILSGGQAPGGHNVIAGLFDGLKKGNGASKLFGFLGGPSGIIKNNAIELTAKLVDPYRNTGGFDIIGSGRTKIEKEEQFAATLATAKKRKLNGIVIIGGDDSNTNAAVLAEYFKEQGESIQVIGVPKTIDGDLKNEYVETSFGFDTAVKTYSELIGNIARDANSAKKYWHFIKLMGRAASHICLECALQTQPNIALISEEVEEKGQTLKEIEEYICSIIAQRAEKGENFGIVLVPEGLIEFIPEMKILISEINDTLANKNQEYSSLQPGKAQLDFITHNLSPASSTVFSSLPIEIRTQLLMDRDPHGNVQVSRIETEKLLISLVEARLKEMSAQGTYKGSFSSQSHFLGYEGRSAFPTNFDADYCYSLGYTAFLLLANGLTGYISSIRNLAQPHTEWIAGGIPITMMMNLERRHGKQKPVIKKALVDTRGKPFKTFAARRERWALKTSYLCPGAIQYFGPNEVCNAPSKTLLLEAKPVKQTSRATKTLQGTAKANPTKES